MMMTRMMKTPMQTHARQEVERAGGLDREKGGKKKEEENDSFNERIMTSVPQDYKQKKKRKRNVK